jgi:hypothetical protein
MQGDVWTDPSVVSDMDPAQDLGAHAYVHTIPETRSPLGTLSFVDRHPMAYQTVVAYDGPGADADPPLVGDVKTPADLGQRVDVDTEPSADSPVSEPAERRHKRNRPVAMGDTRPFDSIDGERPPTWREHVVTVRTEIFSDGCQHPSHDTCRR